MSKIARNLQKQLTITASCVNRLKEIINEDNQFLRVDVESGGCQGLSYKFKIDNKLNLKDDVVFEKEQQKVVVDSESLAYIQGSVIDYQESLIKSSFKIVDNPTANNNCSCGSSFSIDINNNK